MWLADRLGVLEPDELAAVEAALRPLARLIGRPEREARLTPARSTDPVPRDTA
jgi:hypothetical protein